MKVEVSVGEVIDKLSILEIKYEKITDENKRMEIQKEMNALQECQTYKDKYAFFYKLLVFTNTKIWEMTDNVKQMNVDDSNFAKMSNLIFEYNQKRFRVKNWFNLMTSSKIKEQKSYGLTECVIHIDCEETIYDKIAEINYLLLEYDLITFDTSFTETIKQLFTMPTCVFLTEKSNATTSMKSNITLCDFSITQEENKDIFEFIPIKYIAGGAFGDFIHQLSVINETFYKTGQKGILYIADGFYGHEFMNGIEHTYNDTYPVIIKQRYIFEYEIHAGQTHDINLNAWRNNPSLYKKSWYHIFKETYDVEWGKHTWLTIQSEPSYHDCVFINTTVHRWANNIDFEKLQSLHDIDKIYYISSDISQYEFFKNKTQITNIKYIKIDSFEQLCVLVSSCFLIVGSLSAPIAIAHAFNKYRVANVDRSCGDSNMVYGLKNIWDTLHFEI